MNFFKYILNAVLPIVDYTLSFFIEKPERPISQSTKTLLNTWYSYIDSPEFNSIFIREWTNIFINDPLINPFKYYAFMFTSASVPLALLLYYYRPYVFEIWSKNDVDNLTDRLVNGIKNKTYNSVSKSLLENPILDPDVVQQACMKEFSNNLLFFIQNYYFIDDRLNFNPRILYNEPWHFYSLSRRWSIDYVRAISETDNLLLGIDFQRECLRWRSFHHEFNYLQIASTARDTLNIDYVEVTLDCIDFYNDNIQPLL